MSAIKIRAALETALNGITPAIATAWENSAFLSLASSVPYQQVNVLFAEPDDPTYGDTYHLEQGFMQVKLMYPLQAGSLAAMTRAELMRTTFYRGASFSNGGINVVISRTPSISPGNVDGDRWAVIVKIRFTAQVF
jgi:hypothetical protein